MVDIYSYKVSWSLMKGIQIFFKSPLFCFHGNCSKVCATNLFGLSHSTRCGCCSYQVSSISVRRVTSCNNVAPVTNFCLGRATMRSHSSQWSKIKVTVET
jgi:hypothetical protein